MNYYVLYCQTLKIEKVCLKLNRNEQIHAFIPRMEKYIRSIDEVILQVMFPGYLFIKTDLNQIEFDSMIVLMEDTDGIIRELKKADVSALTKDEVNLLKQLLDEEAILRISQGYKDNGKTIVTKGPLSNLEQYIVKVDKRDMLAILNIKFLDRKIKAGIKIKAEQ